MNFNCLYINNTHFLPANLVVKLRVDLISHTCLSCNILCHTSYNKYLSLFLSALLVSYTVWSQWGSSGFRKGGIYHIPEERESWEDVRENVFNYNEEGGGERDQV